MGKFKVRHLVEKSSGFYFQPSISMRRAGYRAESLGKDLEEAIARVEHLNREWDTGRVEAKQERQPAASAGTVAYLADKLRHSYVFLDRSAARQAEIEYSLKIILKVFGPMRLSAVTTECCEEFYAVLRGAGSIHKSARVMKDLRFLFNRAVKLRQMAFNPALSVEVKRPAARRQKWTPKQINKAIEVAWKEGFNGAAVAIAIAYDTGLSPVDIRTLTVGNIQGDRITGVRRAKTGISVEPKLWPETLEWIARYHELLGVASTPQALVVRTRRGVPYQKDRLSRDIRKILRKAGIPDAIQLRDLRRTAQTESAENEATVAESAAQYGWSTNTAAKMLDIYTVRSSGLADRAHDKRPKNMKGPKV